MLNNQQAIQRVQQTFLHPYNDENYSIFISDLLNNLQTNDNFEKQIENDDHIESYKRIGCYEDNNGDIIDILSVKVKNGEILERTRTRLRDFTVNHIRNSPTDPDGCLVAFYAEEFSDWRFSFVKMSYKVVEDLKTGKIKTKEEISQPKRYSFLIGSNEPSYTAQKQMIPLLQSSDIAFNDIVDAFSTERVTNEFYQAYRGLFEDLRKSIKEIIERDSVIDENFKKNYIKTDDFAKKILSQIVFIYFIQRKGWLGIKSSSDRNCNDWKNGDKNFFSNLFNKKYCDYNNFFNEVLEPLFYEALNSKNTFFPLINSHIPFLNGGIFEPLNGYNWKSTDINIDNKIIENIIKVFDRFNFTVKEEQDFEVEVAVDPEMLGKVFENLLDENLRKDLAVFYTPRSIVKQIVKNSLINYLKNRCKNIDSTILRSLIIDKKLDSIDKNHIYQIDKILESIKICDPAIGSGAFPVEFLNRIVETRLILNERMGISKSIYDLKRHCIINSIYGVDIDDGAVQISRLRLFLALIVDEEDYSEISPLPNIDFKLMQGNSLLEDFHGFRLDTKKKNIQGDIFVNYEKEDDLIADLYSKKLSFSNELDYDKKRIKKEQVEKAIIDILLYKFKKSSFSSDETILKNLEDLKTKKFKNFFPWKLYFAEVFNLNGGFDIVIANPPYFRYEKKDKDQIEMIMKDSQFHPAKGGKINAYELFLCRMKSLVNEGGSISAIFQNSFLADNASRGVRELYLRELKINRIDSFPERDDPNKRVFKSAKMSVAILDASNIKTKNNNFPTFFWKSKHINDQSNAIKIEHNSNDIANISQTSMILNLNPFELDLFKRFYNNKKKFSDYYDTYQGELNVKNHIKYFTDDKNDYPILRGAHIQRYYVTDKPSQTMKGFEKPTQYADIENYIKDYAKSKKAFHHKELRIAMQGISGANDKTRITSTIIKPNHLLANSCNYLIDRALDKNFNIFLTIGILNSKLINWIFRKGSSNSNVNNYEIDNLRFPEINQSLFIKISSLVKERLKTKDKNIDILIDKVIYDLYDLNSDDIKIINE